MEIIKGWLEHYGYIVLLFALILELIALPIPGEVLMSYCGFLVFQGKLGWSQSIIVASLGAILGITFSYWLGFRLGIPFFKKYGHYMHMGPEKLEKTSNSFTKYGVRVLAIAYFIPGVRHITGYFSGITKIPYRKFTFYAYTGAIIWTSTFISLGKVLGTKWEVFHHSIKKYLIIGCIIVTFILILVLAYNTYKVHIGNFILNTLENITEQFNSLGKAKIFIASIATIFLGLFIFMMGLIQDLLANEFQQFDKVITLLIQLIFTDKFIYLMKSFGWLASYKVLLPVILLTFLWIICRGRNKALEIAFYMFVIIGGEILDEGLRKVFHRLGPSYGESIYTFPSEQALVSLVIYACTVFVFVRHAKSRFLKMIFSLITVILLIAIGLNRIYFQLQYPSDVVAGYVFGGVWLSFNIFLLEIYRLQISKPNSKF
ncbi:VTT domain-containing protein [Tepidibacter aestuarii]|uniref:VTT domain-containing protein n=1 Tax=Tepidibacter aestuarii TaxID=2925782 RepID=UPI0020C07E26|nr:VTT domain-containing protein [Tepidibacter aestuarii]CAH2213164.1 membrane-associated protein [Tepidibacter aestuarii]